MQEIIYTPESELRFPKQFLKSMLRDLRASREIGWRLFLRNFRSQYRQSVLGYLWLIFPPLITAFIWISLNKTRILNVGETDGSYAAYVLTGIFLWQSFVEIINCPLQQIVFSQAIITKFRVPHEALILSGLGGVIFNLFIRIVILLIGLLLLKVTLSWTLLLVPFGLFCLLTFGLAIGLLITPLGLLYKDVSNVLGSGLQIAFFLTPIIYYVPAGGIASSVVALNPVTPLLVTTRNWLITGTITPQPYFFYVTAVSLVILFFSWVTYRLAKPHLIERISS